MRRDHFDFMKHDRDKTVHEGIRTIKHSLAGCIDCHATKNASGQFVPINAEGEFCQTCHTYAAVKIDCFTCHATVPRGENEPVPLRSSMSQSQPLSSATTRRRFFTQAGAGVALLALAPGVRLAELAVAASDDELVTDAHRWGLWIDTSRCASGCDACVSACNDEHGLTGMGRPETDAQWIRKVDLKDEATGREVSLPLMCQHCEEPPCVDVCPTGASFRREWDRPRGQAYLHRLSLLHDGLPFSRKVVYS